MAALIIKFVVLVILLWKQEFIRNLVTLWKLKIPSSNSCPRFFEPIYNMILLGSLSAEGVFNKLESK